MSKKASDQLLVIHGQAQSETAAELLPIPIHGLIMFIFLCWIRFAE